MGYWVNWRSVLGQVASQTRHEGARDARRTLCTLSVAGDRVTKYGDANWPSTWRPCLPSGGWGTIGPARHRCTAAGCTLAKGDPDGPQAPPARRRARWWPDRA